MLGQEADPVDNIDDQCAYMQIADDTDEYKRQVQNQDNDAKHQSSDTGECGGEFELNPGVNLRSARVRLAVRGPAGSHPAFAAARVRCGAAEG